MKVVELMTVEGKDRYFLADDTVKLVLKYLKFKDNADMPETYLGCSVST